MQQKQQIVDFIKSLYPNMPDLVLLHCPQFLGNEKKYLNECIDTQFVSYVSHFVTDMENKIKEITGAKYAVAMVNGTEALHMVLVASGIETGDEIITQSLTFVATAAAIVHSGASPIFIDVDRETMGMSPTTLRKFLDKETETKGGIVINKKTGKRIRAVVPMHTFGHPCKIDEIKEICDEYNLLLIEDSAESLGSYYKGKHTGTFGKAGILSFNGNKLVTTGGGGMVITDDEELASRSKYISTTAKQPHRWEFVHTEVGYNLRMPGLNAAVGFAQLEYFEQSLKNKRETARIYSDFFKTLGIDFITEPENCKSNYWLNAILLKDRVEREEFLEYANDNKVQCRPIWTLMHKLSPYKKYQCDDMTTSEFFEDRIVNIPSSIRVNNNL